MRNFEPPEIDPLVRRMTAVQAGEDLKEYLSLLDSCCDEHKLQRFLADRSYFFSRLLRLNGQSPLYSKVQLGDQYETDFACFDSGSSGPEWYLIEIESPAAKIFTKSGQPSARLSHAMQQVRDWLSWVHDNLGFARKLMPHIDYPLGYIFIGRRTVLGESERKRLKRLNFDNRLSFRVHTLDWFADSARDVLGMLGQHEHGSWLLPMKALTHKQLRRGLPPDARQYMKGFVSMLIKSRRYPKEMIEEREVDEWPYGQGV